MRPWATLLGVVMGSAVALFAGLAMTLVVYLLLPEFHDRLAGEFRPLLTAVAWAASLVAGSVLAFAGELKGWPRRRLVQAGLGILLVVFGWSYWPA
ncbi:MAG: hypothetical protein ABI616_02440 [Pseudomonadota bacterium]